MAYKRAGYWYRSRRNGRQVQTEYLGPGALGEFVALIDAQQQGERCEQREAQAVEREAQRAIDRPLDEAGAELRELLRVVLASAGYHQHKGTWRKRRNGNRGR